MLKSEAKELRKILDAVGVDLRKASAQKGTPGFRTVQGQLSEEGYEG